MQHGLSEEWTIKSAGGSTGEAYYAQLNDRRLFLKRNSSPFLAVLSAQGIVPKLVWTKRLENGDVITAQDWVDGKDIIPEVIQHPKVSKLLGRIHHSAELLDLLTRMGKDPLNPKQLYENLEQVVYQQNESFYSIVLNQSLTWLKNQLHTVVDINPVVCHCDLNHNNLLLTEEGQIYLIDWDNAEIGDPAIDLAMLFKRYVEEDEWNKWLESYGVQGSPDLFVRIHWYMIYDQILEIDRVTTLEAYHQEVDTLKQLLCRANVYLNDN